MHRRARSLAALALAALLMVLTTACGGLPNATPDPDPDPDPNGEPEPYWEMVVTSGSDEPFEVVGDSVAFASANVVV